MATQYCNNNFITCIGDKSGSAEAPPTFLLGVLYIYKHPLICFYNIILLCDLFFCRQYNKAVNLGKYKQSSTCMLSSYI